jgi:hypothetical protein
MSLKAVVLGGVIVTATLGGFAAGRASVHAAPRAAARQTATSRWPLDRATLFRMANTCVGLGNRHASLLNTRLQPQSTGLVLKGPLVLPRSFMLTPAHVRFILEPCIGQPQGKLGP